MSQHSESGGYEKEDVDGGSVFRFVGWFVLITALLSFWTAQYYFSEKEVQYDRIALSPELQVGVEARLLDKKTLSEYGVIDKENMVFRIPIDRAIELMLTKGLFAQQDTEERPDVLKKIDVVERLGVNVPLTSQFMDGSDSLIQLGKYLKGKVPVVLMFAYYKCPMLCGLVMNGVSDVIKNLELKLGSDYQIVTISINPEETPLLAKQKKAGYAQRNTESNVELYWHFLTGKEEDIKTLTGLTGFKYFYDEKIGEYGHPAVLIVLSPEGKISRYLYGIEFNAKDLKYALIEASEGRIGSGFDRIILSCYQYDPNSRSYTPVVKQIMKLGAGLTIFIMGLGFIFLWVRYRRKQSRKSLKELK
ncbi:hypothetical protein CHS0354_023982 [Potamilus streckersoni]|uniref:Thioredoxin domain-containing protein n=1 Tax=Potamilus streckersoni TaxID=2493646 RepID=A0AAE0VLX5_9BIVA|nr:hypothetical protein CHS0354_023982 [Potamilus streckersoni]